MLKWIAIGTAALMISPISHAREFFTTQLTFALLFQDVLNQRPIQLGHSVNAIYYFSDDGQVVLENGLLQHGVNLTTESADEKARELKITLDILAVQSLIDAFLPKDTALQNHRADLLDFLALSLDRIVPMELLFDRSTPTESGFYQLHSSYRDQTDRSYHIYITATRPIRAIH